MSKITDALTRKIGPLPAWAWGGLAAGGVWIWRGFRGTLTEPPPAAADTVGLDGGMTPGMPSFGAPAGDPSPLYVSADPYGFTFEGDPGSAGLIEQLLAQMRADTQTGGGGTAPAPTQPTSQPAPTQQTSTQSGTTTTTTTRRYRLARLGGSETLGIYDTRLACAQAAAAADPNSSPPGSNMGCYPV